MLVSVNGKPFVSRRRCSLNNLSVTCQSSREVCQHLGMYECGSCYKHFCLLHIFDINEDKKYGDDPILFCDDCLPVNEYGQIDPGYTDFGY